MDRGHQPVLLEEAIASLMVSMDGAYVDGTFGRGGHSTRILDALSPLGTLLALDQDPAAAEAARHLSERDARFRFQACNFRSLSEHAAPESLQGVLLDLGVSSPQLDDPERGFSFSADGPLDMRMDPTQGQSAQAWLACVDQNELAQVLKDLGEERFAKRIAEAIVASRADAPITRTGQLAEIISAANPKWEAHKHPATRSFQAIRLFVNSELESLRSVLAAAVEALAPGGRLVVISFHSLEDRIVKRFIREAARGVQLPPGVPVQFEAQGVSLKSIGKAIKPSAEEVTNNPRARSAIMRVAERV
ncbi:MAG: 16S rRNA (cytosine(1402)-N(4))-methyltransferase [Halieaceae bacterium]|nr:16S rRNA (cytosine(1402)-N(4))-methyltransferase [Halieaceae bacterium]